MYQLILAFVCGMSSVAFFKFINIRGLFSKLIKDTPKLYLGTSNDFKMVIVVRTDLKMGKGKIAAQCCHAALGCYKKALKKAPEELEKWLTCGQPKIVLKLEANDSHKELYELEGIAKKMGVTCSVVHDAGHTQVQSGTATCAGFGPGPASLIDEITGNLKLL